MSTIQAIYKNIFLKIKPLDWVIIAISFGVLVFFVAASLNQERWITIEFKVTNPATYFPNMGGGDAPYWVADKIRTGDIQYDTLGKKNLEILSIKKWGYQYKETWVTASIKAKYKPKQKKYTFLYQPLEIGRSIDVTINGSNIHGIVSSIEGFSDTRPLYTIWVKTRIIDSSSYYSMNTRGVDSWVAQHIDKNEQIRDLYGKVIATILDLEIKPAERVVTTYDGRVLVIEDPLKKDVYLTLELQVTKPDNTYMFLEDKPILIGSSVPLLFKNLVIFPVITEILEPK